MDNRRPLLVCSSMEWKGPVLHSNEPHNYYYCRAVRIIFVEEQRQRYNNQRRMIFPQTCELNRKTSRKKQPQSECSCSRSSFTSRGSHLSPSYPRLLGCLSSFGQQRKRLFFLLVTRIRVFYTTTTVSLLVCCIVLSLSLSLEKLRKVQMQAGALGKW